MHANSKYRSRESQSLLSSFSQNETGRRGNNSGHLTGFCLTSKTALLILIWTVFVGALHFVVHFSIIILIYLSNIIYVNVVLPFVILSFFVMLLFTFYPLSGYFADVWCGRFKTIIASLALLLLSTTLCLGCLLPFYLFKVSNMFLYSVVVIPLFVSIIGIAGYGANFIQFGLDQLLDAPSQHQALFVHWAKWCYDSSTTIILFLICVILCHEQSVILRSIFIASFHALITVMLLLSLVFGYWKYHWFNSEPGHQNPYKIVIKVLMFAWKNNQIFHRSAFTYCDDERPSRLDFAKERFGGPFTTEQVEDVKTLLKVVAVLLAIGPIFILDAPTSTVLVAVMNSHTSGYFCSWSWIFVTSGLQRHIASTLFLPIYMWIIFGLLHKRIPKIFCRLGFGIFLYFLGELTLFIVDVIGHIQHQGNDTQCIYKFVLPGTNYSGYYDVVSLDMHWAVNIPSSVLTGIGSTVVTVTIFEFISAQSPHSMKGLLLGTHFAITGVYQFFSSIALVPFTSHKLWSDGLHSPHIGCLFGYLLLLCLVAFAGLMLFLVAARWYKYRERDDRPYDHRFVIDVYNRYLNQAQDYESSSEGD